MKRTAPLFILLVLILPVVVLTVRLFSLQVVMGKRYFDLSSRNSTRVIVTLAPRGRILDAHGRILADSRPGYHLTYVKSDARGGTIDFIASLLDRDPDELLENAQRAPSPYVPVRIARDLNFASVARVEEYSSDLPGVRIEIEPVRRYFLGEAVFHCLGYVGDVSEEEREKDPTYYQGDKTGKRGLEKVYERFLRGRNGAKFVEVDALGYERGPSPERKGVPPLPGNDIYLTVRAELESLAFSILEPYSCACLIAMRPSDGAILALVSKPSIDPNKFAVGLPPGFWQEVQKSEVSPFWNRAIQASYPPGSTFKLLTMAIGLEEGLVRPETRFEKCTGEITIGNKVCKCWEIHGSLSLLDALAQSCNVYFYQMGMLIGAERILRYAKQCGFGKPTGVDLTGEGRGFIPTLDWYDERYGKRGWGRGIAANLAIGQGEILVTPLQLLRFVCGIANNGRMPTPHLLNCIVSPEGDTVEQWTPSFKSLPFSETVSYTHLTLPTKAKV